MWCLCDNSDNCIALAGRSTIIFPALDPWAWLGIVFNKELGILADDRVLPPWLVTCLVIILPPLLFNNKAPLLNLSCQVYVWKSYLHLLFK